MQTSGLFSLYSDIHFFFQAIDSTLKTKKIVKKEDVLNKKIFMEFIKEEIEIPKRANSMIPFRPHSQTVDSKATRDSSIKRESSGLIKQSSEKNINKIKDKNNSNKIEKEKEKEKIENDDNKTQIIIEEKKENVSNNEKPKKNVLTLVEFIDKIITGNYIKENAKLINHFCQQCFSFIKLETLFNQITNTYENIKKENSVEKLKKLIIFINALFLEMISYYGDKKLLNDNISYAETFYCKLISDLIIDLKYNKEEKSEIQPFKLDNENITINDNNDKNKNIDNIYEINKTNLIKVNLHNPEKKFEINIMNCRKSVKIIERKKEKEKEKEEESKKINLRKSKHLSSNKIKVKDIIKEEEEKKVESDGEIEKEVNKSKKNSELNQNINNSIISFTESSLEEEEKYLRNNKDNKSNIIIEEIMKKGNIKEEIITSKEKQIKHLRKIIILFDKIKKEEEIKVIEIKNKLLFYKILQKKKEKEKRKLLITIPRSKRNTQIFTSSKNAIQLKKEQSKIIREYLKKGYFCVKDWKTEEIGNQLMLISKGSLNKIRPRELYKAIFLKKEKEITSPNVVNCINKFNRLTSFIMEDILSYNSPKDRAKAYEKWISIAEYCRVNKDYNDLIAIFSAFNHYVITGLKLTLKEVRTKYNNILNKIRNFCAVEGNYKKIRTEMDFCNKNEEIFIPYLGMLLRDLNFFEEKSKYIDEKGNINFEKIEKINEMFEFYFKFKKKMNEDKYKNKIEELNFFEDLEDIKEEELEDIANNIEPEFKIKECKNKRKRLTKIDEKYFEKYKDNKEEDINSQQDLDEAFII